IQIGLRRFTERGDLKASQAQYQRRQQTDRPRAHDGGPPGFPYSQASLNFICLRDSFFDHRGWLKQHADFFESLWNLDDEFGIIDVVLAHVAMTEIDPSFKVGIVSRHVVRAN